MTAAEFFDRPAVRRSTKFLLAIGGAALLLWAFAVRARATGGGSDPTAGLDAVRWISAAACLIAASIAPRVGSRVEAVGFVVAAIALSLSVASDFIIEAILAPSVGAEVKPRTADLVFALRVAWPVVVLGIPLLIGAGLLGTPAPDLLRQPSAGLRAIAAALVAGFAIYPVLAVATSAVNAGVDAWVGLRQHPWTGWEAALGAEIFEGVVDRPFRWVAVALAIEFPLLELLLHGVLRQALSRWGAMGFVMGTAILAPILLLSGQLSFFLFGGCIVTGLFAARTASVVPGFTFWIALVYGRIAWRYLLFS